MNEDLTSLLLGGRTPEEVVADVSRRIADDARRGTIYGQDIVREKHFTHGGMHPVPIAYTKSPESTTPEVRKLAIEERIRADLAQMENDPELAAALERQHEEMRASITNPQFIDEGTSPELLELFKQDPFILSRWR
jgi:hypothetical protein